MPLFEFVCRECGETTEILIREGQKPACGKCGSTRLEKQGSHFAPMRGGKAPEPACAGGGCSTGSCPYSGVCGM
jgi:putative FmdB family regulatory protein